MDVELVVAPVALPVVEVDSEVVVVEAVLEAEPLEAEELCVVAVAALWEDWADAALQKAVTWAWAELRFTSSGQLL